MLLVAFGHQARSGKDTACAILLKHYARRMGMRRYAFTDEVKRMVGVVPGATLTGNQRLQCRLLGEAMRKQDPEFWIKKVDAIIRYAPPDVAIVTDLCYRNEFAWVRGEGGRAVKLIRPGVKPPPELTTSTSEHQLVAFPDTAWDAVIISSSVSELEEKVVGWFSSIIVPQLELAGLMRQDGIKGDRYETCSNRSPLFPYRN